jgi:hypothetical protein
VVVLVAVVVVVVVVVVVEVVVVVVVVVVVMFASTFVSISGNYFIIIQKTQTYPSIQRQLGLTGNLVLKRST